MKFFVLNQTEFSRYKLHHILIHSKSRRHWNLWTHTHHFLTLYVALLCVPRCVSEDLGTHKALVPLPYWTSPCSKVSKRPKWNFIAKNQWSSRGLPRHILLRLILWNLRTHRPTPHSLHYASLYFKVSWRFIQGIVSMDMVIRNFQLIQEQGCND